MRPATDTFDNVRLLAFNAAVDLQEASGVTGWIYHPRIDCWRNEEQVQFVLDYAVVDGAPVGQRP